MAGVEMICDTGPLVAFFNRADQYHSWAKEQFDHISRSLVTCDAVVSETMFLLHDDGLSADPLFEVIERGKLLVTFQVTSHWPDIRRLVRKYENLPMSLADACLVRMSELSPECQIITTDRHFRIYRRHGRQIIPLLAPF
jgi:predicted nucleic acid-binding protein